MQKRLCSSTATLGFYTQCRPPFTHQEGKQPGRASLHVGFTGQVRYVSTPCHGLTAPCNGNRWAPLSCDEGPRWS